MFGGNQLKQSGTMCCRDKLFMSWNCCKPPAVQRSSNLAWLYFGWLHRLRMIIVWWEPIRNELTRNLSGNIQPQSSQLAEPLWSNPGIKSGIIVCELISTLKKKCRRGINGRIFSYNPRKRGKSHHQVIWRRDVVEWVTEWLGANWLPDGWM